MREVVRMRAEVKREDEVEASAITEGVYTGLLSKERGWRDVHGYISSVPQLEAGTI